MATTSGRPPLWRDVRVLAWAFQLAVVGLVVAFVLWLLDNFRANSEQRNLTTGYAYLDQPSDFPIPGSDFRQSQPVRDALVEGLQNTLRLAVTGIVLATVLGVLVGVARLSQNFILRNASRVYVEFVRNVPLLAILILFYIAVVLNVFPRVQDSWELGPLAVLNVRGASVFWYEGGNWKFAAVVVLVVVAVWLLARWRRRLADRTGRPARSGLWAVGGGAVVLAIAWLVLGLGATAPKLDGRLTTGGITMTPEYFAALAALVVYTASHIAEIVRGSILAVPRGQKEAAEAIGLASVDRLRFVVLPQAFRVAVPPIGNQYLNLVKNSSLGVAIAFPEVTRITRITISQGAPAPQAIVVLMGVYLAFSLSIALVINIVNRRLALRGR
jgi:general L-amino acid transport system permease protein